MIVKNHNNPPPMMIYTTTYDVYYYYSLDYSLLPTPCYTTKCVFTFNDLFWSIVIRETWFLDGFLSCLVWSPRHVKTNFQKIVKSLGI
jgi:hypothetical protein